MADNKIEKNDDILKEFFIEFDEMYELFNATVDKIYNSPNAEATQEDIASIFRSVHSIKSNCRMVGLIEVSDLIHHLETLLQNIREGKFKFTMDHGDLIRLSLDEARVVIEKQLSGENLPMEFVHITNVIEKIYSDQPAEREEAIDIALQLLDPIFMSNRKKAKVQLEKDAAQSAVVVAPQEAPAVTDPIAIAQAAATPTSEHLEDDTVSELQFFSEVSQAVEKRLKSPQGRQQLIIDLALSLNQAGGNLVEPVQLQVAIYLSNLGLAFLPQHIISKESGLNTEEKKQLISFPKLSSIVLTKMPKWQEAMKIVLQCHERPDGNGYPMGLTDTQICDGAKILAIVETFVAIIYSRPYKQITARTFIAAFMEINKLSGKQFNEKWVEQFNALLSSLHQEQKLLKMIKSYGV